MSDVSDPDKRGSSNPSDWVTYYHVFPNNDGGWSIQYWVFYSFNTGVHVGPFDIGSHGGDWEMVEVVLGASGTPVKLNATGHTSIDTTTWGSIHLHDTHPIVYTERGGHEAHPNPTGPGPFIDHPTWSGATTSFPDGISHTVGPLIDLGTRIRPKVQFLRYSGLWGALGATSISSGYWGPAYNETGIGPDGFLRAWCDGIRDPNMQEGGANECYPDDQQ